MIRRISVSIGVLIGLVITVIEGFRFIIIKVKIKEVCDSLVWDSFNNYYRSLILILYKV